MGVSLWQIPCPRVKMAKGKQASNVPHKEAFMRLNFLYQVNMQGFLALLQCVGFLGGTSFSSPESQIHQLVSILHSVHEENQSKTSYQIVSLKDL